VSALLSNTKPTQIDQLKDWNGVFTDDNHQLLAQAIIIFCQRQKMWAPFDLKDLRSVGGAGIPADMNEGRLVQMSECGWLAREDKKFYVTEDFLMKLERKGFITSEG